MTKGRCDALALLRFCQHEEGVSSYGRHGILRRGRVANSAIASAIFGARSFGGFWPVGITIAFCPASMTGNRRFDNERHDVATTTPGLDR
jgi:hypothetical protein